MTEIVIRFLVGGAIVSGFAVLGDLFRPESFAGIFGAAPSVALATLGIALARHGKPYVAAEAVPMLAGAAALFSYAWLLSWLMMRRRVHALAGSILAIPLWFAVAFALWAVWMR